MKTISTNLEIVNNPSSTDEEKKLAQIELLSSVVELTFGESLESFSVKNNLAEEEIDLKMDNAVGHNAACPFAIRKDICYSPSDKKIDKKTKRKVEEKFAHLYEIEEDRARFFAMLPETYRQILEDMHFIVVKNLNRLIIIPPNEKGSPSYNKKVRSKLINYAKIFSRHYEHCYFITLTVDLKKFSGGVIKQHRKAVEYSRYFCQKMQVYFKGKYIIVNEEQKRGAIHFHIELFTNQDLHTHNERNRKDGKHLYIYKGELRSFCEKYWPYGHFDLQHAEGEQVIYYTVKYISKKTENDFWQLRKNGEFKGEARKDIMGFVMPTIGGYRSYNTSHLTKEMKKEYEELQKEWEEHREEYKEKKTKEEALQNPKTRFKPLNDYVANPKIVKKALPKKTSCPPQTERDKELARLRAYLISVSDNSTHPCLKWLYSGKYGDLVNRFGTDFRQINALSDEKKRKVTLGCSPLGCGGCVIGQAIIDFITGEKKLAEYVDNRDELKPILWKVLSEEDKQYFLDFNFSSKEPFDTSIFENLIGKIEEEINNRPMPYFFKREKDQERVKAYTLQKPFTLAEWRLLLTTQKQCIPLLNNEKLSNAALNLFKTDKKAIFNPIAPIWQDTGFDEVFDLFKDWLKEQFDLPAFFS